MLDIKELDPTLPVVKNMLLMDNEGKRIAQANYEMSLFAKTSRTNARGEAEVIAFDNVIVVYKFVGDLMFYVAGGSDENEILLYSVLNAFVDSISLLLRCVGEVTIFWEDEGGNAVEKKTVLENLDLILLAMDEIVEGGCVASMSFCRGLEVSNKGANIQTLSQAFGSVRDQLARSLLR
ncbi:hypothetical protein QBZ16_000999 [Prototheca wickerhamii]|uniref:Coatomer subunit zeta n=1 Tax=Prototheca wickerhamii TaxID=3111 RepID=A0AAD9IE04_PROWI|nr:hypothetical protein QBZ16_000999 [Prototheca wickerhamii]